MDNLILEVSHLNAYYKEQVGLFAGTKARKQILHDVSFHMERGEIVGLVGESGCGKSTLGKAILGMVKDTDGSILHHSEHPQMVFQDPYGSLNPVKKVGWIIEEPLRIRGGMTEEERNAKVLRRLHRVGLDEKFGERYPKELSGGQRQRVCIAEALVLNPQLLIADEPVSALDVTVQAQIIELLKQINHDLGIAMLFISHDLKIVYQLCTRVMVMRGGRIVEQGRTDDVYFHPQHEYTKQLLYSAGITEEESNT